MKDKTPHGEWINHVENVYSEYPFSSILQVKKYMKLAQNPQLALMVSDGTITGTCNAITNATDEQKEEAEKLTVDLQTNKDKSIANQMSSESKEWYTPDHILEKVFTVMGDVDLDPCSDPEGTSFNSCH